MNYEAAKNDFVIQIETAEDYKNAAISLMKQARHSIDIFTRDLEAEIFNHKEIEQSVFNLAKKHPDTHTRILLRDSATSVKNGHCLIRLAQQLTSSVFIHAPSEKYKDELCAFVVVDQTGLIYRISDRSYKASFSINHPQRAAKLAGFFNEVWEHSSPDCQTRRLYV
jgi:hypothetical protein